MKTRGRKERINKVKRNNPAPLALKHKEYLTLFSKAKNKARRNKLVDVADGSEVRAVSECIKNILDDNSGNKPIEATSTAPTRT